MIVVMNLTIMSLSIGLICGSFHHGQIVIISYKKLNLINCSKNTLVVWAHLSRFSLDGNSFVNLSPGLFCEDNRWIIVRIFWTLKMAQFYNIKIVFRVKHTKYLTKNLKLENICNFGDAFKGGIIKPCSSDKIVSLKKVHFAFMTENSVSFYKKYYWGHLQIERLDNVPPVYIPYRCTFLYSFHLGELRIRAAVIVKIVGWNRRRAKSDMKSDSILFPWKHIVNSTGRIWR